MTGERFRGLFNRSLADIEAGETAMGVDTGDVNRRLHALYIASTLGLRATSGAECVTLLCESQRIQVRFLGYGGWRLGGLWW